MRERDRCHAHLDADLGPRGAGPPSGNLNALKHGAYAHLLPAPEIDRLVETAVGQPHDLPLRMDLTLSSIQARAVDPFLTLVAFRALLSQLVDRVAAQLYSAELRHALGPVSSPRHNHLRALFDLQLAQFDPEERLLILRRMKK